MSWLGQTLADRYEIRERIGQGGAAEVYKGYDRRLNREVAVKMIHPHLAKVEGFVTRFEREARAIAQLRHANILQVQDFHAEGQTFYMVMEYLRGLSLAGRLNDLAARGERWPWAETIRIMTAIGAAVDYAHSRGIIHRDIKPSNIMFGERGDPILTDFGLAKMLGGEALTLSGALVGTPLYMSPEQVRGLGGDERTDIYSLGVVLYEMATGQPPFTGDVPVNIMLKHLNELPPSPKSLNPDLPEAVERAILTALEKDPDARFQTAGELVAALESVANRGPSPVVLPAPSPKQARVAPPAAVPVEAGRKATPRPRREAAAPPSATLIVGPTLTKTPPSLIWIAIPAALIVVGIAAALIVVALLPKPVTSQPTGEGMLKVAGGAFLVGAPGAGDANHVSQRRVELPTVWIDRYEVTNAQYAALIGNGGGKAPYGWKDGTFPAGEDTHPVRGVTFDEAAAYCAAVGKRLPGEAEWEAAARGAEGRLYPWGDDPNAVKLDPANTYPVGSVAANQSPFGVYDLAGNAWEWVRDPYEPVKAGDAILRGGSYNYLQDMAYRLEVNPAVLTAIVDAGFRCAASEVKGEK